MIVSIENGTSISRKHLVTNAFTLNQMKTVTQTWMVQGKVVSQSWRGPSESKEVMFVLRFTQYGTVKPELSTSWVTAGAPLRSIRQSRRKYERTYDEILCVEAEFVKEE